MKYFLIYPLFLVGLFHTSCEQNQTDAPEAYIMSEFKDTVTSYGPSRMVRNIKQAKNGDIFIAAFNGVFRYDGKSFTNITSRIPSPSFWDVLEDRKGNLWFGTRDSGVYRFNGKSFQHFTTRQGLASNLALHIYEDKAGNIWFGTGGGASRYDGKYFQNFTTKEGLPHNGVSTIMEDKTGKFWFGTGEHLSVYDGKVFTTLANKDGKAFKNVRCVIEDKKGNIWLGGTDGLWRYDGSTFTSITRRFIGNIYEDKKGSIWTTGEVNPYESLWSFDRYDQKSLYNKKPTVTEILSIKKMLCGIMEANDVTIWFGSLNGVYRYDGKTITEFRRKEDQQ